MVMGSFKTPTAPQRGPHAALLPQRRVRHAAPGGRVLRPGRQPARQEQDRLIVHRRHLRGRPAGQERIPVAGPNFGTNVCSSRRRSSPATVTPACRSQPAHRACSGRDDSTHGASGAPPSRSTRAPARGPEREPPLDRRTREAGQCQRLGRQRVGRLGVHGQAPAGQQPADAAGDRGHQPRDVGVRRSRQAMEPHRAVHPRREHAVEPQCMEVHVQFQPAPSRPASTRCAACSAMRRPPQLAQIALALGARPGARPC